MKKPLNFIIPGTVYPFDVMVSIGESNEVLYKRLVKLGVKQTDIDLAHAARAQGRCVMFEGGQTLVRLYRYPTTAQQYGYLQHEIFHAVEFIMDRIGIKLCHKSDEAYAYLIGYLTETIYKKLGWR